MRRGLGESGITMVEVGITVAIIGILAAIAVPSFNNLMPRIKLGNATQTLANQLAMARVTAIAKSVDGKVTFDEGADSYSLYKDKNDNNTQYGNTTLAPTDLESITYLADGSTAPDTVVIKATGGTNVPLLKQALVITLRTTTGTELRRRVLVWTSGRVNTEKWAGGTSWVAD